MAFDNAQFDEARCLFAPYPTLSEVSAGEGQGAAVAWVVAQLWGLGEFCGAKEKMSSYQMEHLARLIVREYFYLKVSELMMFFHRFRTGRYGRFYGSVDPMVITVALRQFCSERNELLEHYEGELREEARALNSRGAVSREKYNAMVEAGEPILPAHHVTINELIKRKYGIQ